MTPRLLAPSDTPSEPPNLDDSPAMPQSKLVAPVIASLVRTETPIGAAGTHREDPALSVLRRTGLDGQATAQGLRLYQRIEAQQALIHGDMFLRLGRHYQRQGEIGRGFGHRATP